MSSGSEVGEVGVKPVHHMVRLGVGTGGVWLGQTGHVGRPM